MPRRALLLTLTASLLALPGLTQPPDPQAGFEMLRMISRFDPETDPILAAVHTAVEPSEDQMTTIVELYRELRESQQKAFLETMRQRMAQRAAGAGGAGADGDSIMPEVFQHVEQANHDFLEGARAVLTARQQPLWDACVADLQLQPMGHFPPGLGGDIDPAKKGPTVGEPAPEFQLVDVEGRVVTLESLRGKPVVIEFGSLSCPMFRGKVDPIREQVKQFSDRVHWVVVYTREAHAAGTPREAMINPAVGIEIPEHETFADRLSNAWRTAQELDLARTILVDDFDDSVTRAYGGFPNWGFIVDAEGNLAARQVWSDPAGISRALRKLLGVNPAVTRARPHRGSRKPRGRCR